MAMTGTQRLVGHPREGAAFMARMFRGNKELIVLAGLVGAVVGMGATFGTVHLIQFGGLQKRRSKALSETTTVKSTKTTGKPEK